MCTAVNSRQQNPNLIFCVTQFHGHGKSNTVLGGFACALMVTITTQINRPSDNNIVLSTVTCASFFSRHLIMTDVHQ